MTSTTTATANRTIYLPLETVDKCSACGKTTTRQLCSACGEKAYCSRECQEGDWVGHKKTCGKTDRISLETFYPFLANLIDSAHVHPDRPVHDALSHQIINDPHPWMGPTQFPDGYSARVVVLGPEIPEQIIPFTPWWPSAAMQEVRNRLYMRILREGWLVPNNIAACLALLATIYSTTWIPASDSPDGNAQRRTRLNYRSSPIADFGIAKGEFSLVTQDLLAYINVEDIDLSFEKLKRGQDHKNHYWIYFTTAKGEEIFLDCGLYTWNMALLVNHQPYLSDSLPTTRSEYCPAYFVDRYHMRNVANMHTVKKCFSILRNTNLHEAVEEAPHFNQRSRQAIWRVMDEIAGERCSDLEKQLAIKWAIQDCEAMAAVLEDQRWKKWPKDVAITTESDPGEPTGPTPNEERGLNEVIRLNRKFNRGEITKDQLKESFHAWKERMAREA